MANGLKGSDINSKSLLKSLLEKGFDATGMAYDYLIGDSLEKLPFASYFFDAAGVDDAKEAKDHAINALAETMGADADQLNADITEFTFGWLDTALLWLEDWINPEAKTARLELAKDILTAPIDATAVKTVGDALGDDIKTLAPTLDIEAMLKAGRTAAAESLAEPYLWTSWQHDGATGRLTHLQHAHDAATNAMGEYLNSTLNIDLPEADRVDLIMNLSDAAATGITGIPAPKRDAKGVRRYAALDATGALSDVSAGLAAYVKDGTTTPNLDFSALQTTAQGFATEISGSAEVHRKEIARIETEVAQLSLTGIANETTQNKIRESLTALRSNDRITDVEFTNIQTALRTDARGIDIMLHSLADLDTTLIQDVVIPNDITGEAIVDLQDGTDVVPENSYTANAEEKQFGYRISAAPVLG